MRRSRSRISLPTILCSRCVRWIVLARPVRALVVWAHTMRVMKLVCAYSAGSNAGRLPISTWLVFGFEGTPERMMPLLQAVREPGYGPAAGVGQVAALCVWVSQVVSIACQHCSHSWCCDPCSAQICGIAG